MHIPVLFRESVDALSIKKDGTYIDGTLGGASHALEIAKHLAPDGTLIGFDLDSNAIARAKEKLLGVKCNVILVRKISENLIKSFLKTRSIKWTEYFWIWMVIISNCRCRTRIFFSS